MKVYIKIDKRIINLLQKADLDEKSFTKGFKTIFKNV